MTNFWGKFLVENSGEKKLHHTNSDKILSNFCSVHFLSNLNPNLEKRV